MKGSEDDRLRRHRRARVYLDEKGEPSRMVGTVYDITEQKEAEEALRESEQRFLVSVLLR